jgi:hypothetical protein
MNVLLFSIAPILMRRLKIGRLDSEVTFLRNYPLGRIVPKPQNGRTPAEFDEPLTVNIGFISIRILRAETPVLLTVKHQNVSVIVGHGQMREDRKMKAVRCPADPDETAEAYLKAVRQAAARLPGRATTDGA